MALFSRRKKTDDAVPQSDEVSPSGEVLEVGEVPQVGETVESGEVRTSPDGAAADESPTAETGAASVNISVSSYQGLGAQAAPPAPPAPAAPPAEPVAQPPAPAPPRPAEAPAPTETIPGLRDNVLLRDALAALPAQPESTDLLEVARQMMQGHLFLRVKGDARALLAEGKDLPLGVAKVGDAQYVLAFSSGAALRKSLEADRDTDTSAMGQPVLAVLRHTLAGPYTGLIIDNSSAPARAVLPRELIEKLVEQADPSLELKTLLAGERTAETGSRVSDALTRVKFWVAVNTSAEGRMGVAEARGTDGSRLIELYSHPLEVATLRRGDQAAPMTAAQLGAALRADEALDGAIVDAHGPWIRLSRDDLAPVIALAGS